MKSIKVKTEKVLNQGEQNYLIVEISALSEAELPSRYLRGNPQAYLSGDTLVIKDERGGASWLVQEMAYSPSALDFRLEILREAGQRLHEINLQLEKENAGWSGEETFII